MKKKAFDCVEMKNSIQIKLLEKYEGLTDEDIERQRELWLATSKSDMAQWWRASQAARRRQKQTVPTSSLPA